ncbi:MAG TPA: glycosyltransferase family 4 protein [Candidatus Saccharimonadales bacterium]|nr:glycosyltransferase family 4 protein [Candidatus Saccharimonadales bacterium]
MTKRRILLLHYTSPGILGGVERIMRTHASALRAAGDDVRIVAGRGRPSPAGVPLIRIGELDSRHPAVLRDFAALAAGEVTAAHAALVDRIERALTPHVRRAERVVVHNAFTLHKNAALTEALVRLAASRTGTFVAWTHDLAWTDEQYAAQRHAGRPWSLFATAHPGVRYVAVSEKAAAELAALTGLARRRIAIVPNGVDPVTTLGLSPAGARLAERLGLYAADPLLLLPVRITRRKRIDVAIAALALLRRTHPRAVLVVTGGPGAHNPANAAHAAELRTLAGAGVHLLHDLGVRPSDRVVADLYALADALVLPSANEGFGIPVLEAGLHRLPIVCSDIPALRAVAGDDATYVAPDAGAATLAAAIERRLAADPVARLHRRARESAWPRILAELVLPAIHHSGPTGSTGRKRTGR